MPEAVRARVRPPLAVVLGSPAEVVHLLTACPGAEAVCYQMDLYQAERLREELAGANVAARVETLPDLWDLPADFQSAVYMPARGGERELKIDMVEQAFHVLRPGGALAVWSSYETDPFFPTLLKKVFGRVHENRTDPDTVLWSPRVGDRPRRRHEVTFQARVLGGPPCRFLSRPGVFSYGRFDDGARRWSRRRRWTLATACWTWAAAAARPACSRPRPRGRTGISPSWTATFGPRPWPSTTPAPTAWRRSRRSRRARWSGRRNGRSMWCWPTRRTSRTTASRALFIERARALLKPKGRLFLVTKHPNPVAEMIADTFGAVEGMLRRGYTILCA